MGEFEIVACQGTEHRAAESERGQPAEKDKLHIDPTVFAGCILQSESKRKQMSWRGGSGQNDDNLREGNDESLDSLYGKIRQLKDVTVEFERDAIKSNAGLDLVDGDMGGMSGVLRGTMRRIDQYVEATGNPRMVYLVVGFTAILMFLYYVLGRATSSI